MTRFRALLVDDEPLARQRLGRLLREAGCEVLAELGHVRGLLEFLREGPRPDVLFLDIEMPGGSGWEALAEMQDPPPTIFVTAFPEHAPRAFDADVVDYLMKPVYPERLNACLAKVQRHLDRKTAEVPPPASSTRFPARAAGSHFFLDLRKVSHFEFDNWVVWAWIGGQRFKAPWNSLGDVEAAFPRQVFLRIQRHLLVRLEAILSLRALPGGRAIVLVGHGIELEASRRATPKLRQTLGIGKVEEPGPKPPKT